MCLKSFHEKDQLYLPIKHLCSVFFYKKGTQGGIFFIQAQRVPKSSLKESSVPPVGGHVKRTHSLNHRHTNLPYNLGPILHDPCSPRKETLRTF